MCSSLSLPTKRGDRKNHPKLPNPDRQIQEIFFENRLGYNCQDGCTSASPHLNQSNSKSSNPLIMFGYEHPENIE